LTSRCHPIRAMRSLRARGGMVAGKELRPMVQMTGFRETLRRRPRWRNWMITDDFSAGHVNLSTDRRRSIPGG
jgi:hypothetical protein